MYLYDVPLNQEMVNRIYSDGHKIYSGMSNSLEKFIEELRDMIEFHDIQFYNETLPALKSERRALEQQVSEQTDLITSLNGQQNDLIEKRSIFKTQLGVKSSNISHLEQEITNTQNNCIDYKTQHIAIFNEELMLIQKIEDYVKEHKGLREEQNSPIHEESYSILDLLKQIKERIQGSISRNNDAIDECSNKIDQMNNEIEQIESEISSLEGEVSNVQTSLSSIADQISDANNHINQLNNEISELDSEIASAIEAHENWKAEQEAIIANFEETIAQNNPSLLQDGGQYLGSSVIDYTRGDSIKLLNLFEYIEVENPGDYFPILSRVQHSSASMYAQNIISPFYTEFSVAMEDTYWANFRTEITHLLVVACGDVHCNTLTFYLSIDATNAGFDCLDYLLPLNLHEPHIFSVPNQHCTSTFPMQIGDENVPTYLGIDDIDLVVAKYIVFARLS